MGEACERSGADALGGRVGIGEAWVGFFKILEFAEEFVVVGIGNFRFGLGVVEVVVVIEELAKLGGAVLRRGKAGEEV